MGVPMYQRGVIVKDVDVLVAVDVDKSASSSLGNRERVRCMKRDCTRISARQDAFCSLSSPGGFLGTRLIFLDKTLSQLRKTCVPDWWGSLNRHRRSSSAQA